MKLSLAWVFDHIDADWRKVDVAALATQFNQVVAEIEGFEKLHVDTALFTVAQVKSAQGESVVLHSPEWQQEFTLPARKSAQAGQWYMVKKSDAGVNWATTQDFGGGKEGALPALHVEQQDQAGGWKTNFESHDYIIELDNKSVTHRPDMWGHRGFAREIAAMLNLPFKPLDGFLAKKNMHQYATSAQATETEPIDIKVENPEICKRFAGMYLDQVAVRPCALWMAHRLMRVDARPIDGLVDITNYVMLDLGQPMHAFDGNLLTAKKMVVRLAKNKETLTLLDGQTVELCDEDLIITDGTKPLALAGVMGGKDSGVSTSTTAILIESACFDAVTVRRTATRYKKRTEASARFEKTLDPNQNVDALLRFLKLFKDAGLQAIESDEIFSLGQPAQPGHITISHEMIEKRLGATIAPDFVVETLTHLEFGVQVADGQYTITVPTFRATKDVKIKEDIVEEIGRFYGYTNLAPQLPLMPLRPADLGWVYTRRTIKNVLAYAMSMRELYPYAFYDEEFLTHLKWQPTDVALEVQSPVSENWRRLVSSLIPGLLKAVMANSADYDTLRFFELGRIWTQDSKINEQQRLSGIFYDKKSVDFYAVKAELQKLFDALQLEITWHKVDQPDRPWFAPYQTALLMHNGTAIGVVGKLHPTFLSGVCQGDACMFELDADYLLYHKPAVKKYVPVSKYPEMARDVSMLVSLDVTVDQATKLIAQTDPKIVDVALVDFFEKEEWPDKRSMTFRFIISDTARTMTKEEADAIWENVVAQFKNMGATIR